MKAKIGLLADSLRRAIARPRRRSPQRDLARELSEQRTEGYWRRRANAESRRFWWVARRYRLAVHADAARGSVNIALTTVPSVLRGFAIGGLLLIIVLLVEAALPRFASRELVPSTLPAQSLSAFPTLAVQVSASLLGFYLAAVSIVLGTSYHTVSADVRSLVLRNERTRLYLQSIGMSIGAGLALVLLQSVGVGFGYVSIVAYACLVAFSGWAFAQLAFGAFHLFNPVVLSEEPLRVLYRAIDRLDSQGLRGDQSVLQTHARHADRALRVLAELIELTRERVSVDREDLARSVERLLFAVRLYSERKHLLAPSSAWFLPEVVYPRWVESDSSAVSIALDSSTPLQPRMEPVTDWLEKRAAELASAALEACVVTNERNPCLRITAAVAETAHALARQGQLDDALVFAEIVRDRCWALGSENAAAIAVAAEPPLILSNLLLGWREAAMSWPEEVREVVASTEWDRSSTQLVRIRGTRRVWRAAQRLLREVQAEQEIEGRRATPDWYLQFALAGECILSLREFAQRLPDVLDEYSASAAVAQSPAVVKAAAAAQALQAVVKAEIVAGEIVNTLQEFQTLRLGHDPIPLDEIEALADQVEARRSTIIEHIAEAVAELRPERSRFEPDLFGEALFRLVHHTEEAIATGNETLVERVFPRLLVSSFVLDDHVRSTYVPPTYQVNSAILDPVMDLLELSGLALVYEALRNDSSADAVRRAWHDYVASQPQPQETAKKVLAILDLADGFAFGIGISPRSIARTEWETRLSRSIVDAGYARPDYTLFGGRPAWEAPLLIKMVGVSETLPRMSLHPRTIFAAEIIAPLSSEPEAVLHAHPGLRRYYEARELHADDAPGEDACGDE